SAIFIASGRAPITARHWSIVRMLAEKKSWDAHAMLRPLGPPAAGLAFRCAHDERAVRDLDHLQDRAFSQVLGELRRAAALALGFASFRIEPHNGETE